MLYLPIFNVIEQKQHWGGSLQQIFIAVVRLQRELKNQHKFLVQFLNKQDVPKTLKSNVK